ncbi:hypothetical protein LSH36_547g05040, partial [Paralvinella palmiformis]
YNCICRNRILKSRGGVAIYISSNISCKIREELSTFSEREYESLFIETNIQGNKVTLGEIYRTPASNAKKYVEYFENTLEKLKNDTFLILGTDQNFDLFKVDNHPQTSSLLNIFLASSFLLCISKPTRITDHLQTLIDNIYTNNIQQDTVIRSGLLLEDTSDHLPTLCSISTKRPPHEKLKTKIIERRNIKPQSLRLINERMQQINWDYLRNIDIEHAWQSFNDTLKIILMTLL